MAKKNNQSQKKANKQSTKNKQTPFANAGRTIGRELAAFIHPSLGGFGAGAGRYVGSAIGKIFGSGSYAMTNSCWDVAQQCPSMHSNDESVIFRHREYIGDISGTSAFTLTEFPINPGIDTTFPYLSTLAQNFQQYRFRGLVFEYRSTSATSLVSGTNTAMGAVMFAAQYRADAPNFVDKQSLLNEMWSVDCKPSENVFLPVECAQNESPLKYNYVRTGALLPNQDIKLYDLATLAVAVSGSQATNIIGELWVSYEIELKKPTLSGSLSLAGESFVADRGGITSSVTLGTTNNSVYDSIGVIVNSNNFVLPIGTNGVYYVTAFWFGTTGVASVTLPSIALTNCSYVSVSSNNRQDNASGSGSGILEMSTSFLIRKDDPNVTATVTYTGGAYPIGTLRCNLQIHQVNGGITSS